MEKVIKLCIDQSFFSLLKVIQQYATLRSPSQWRMAIAVKGTCNLRILLSVNINSIITVYHAVFFWMKQLKYDGNKNILY